MFFYNKYRCPKGHVTYNIQSDGERYCKTCFVEWRDQQFPMTAEAFDLCYSHMKENCPDPGCKKDSVVLK
jgi:hypothetical protein